MTFGNLNYWPILIAAVASFAFGAVWYGALGRQWMAARGLSEADMAKAKAEMGRLPVPYIIAFVALLDHGLDARRRPAAPGASGGLATSLADRPDLRLLPVARLRHHHHGRQSCLPGRASGRSR